MKKEKILVLTTTFTRWKNDVTHRFVYDLSKRLTSSYKIIVLAPHYNKAAKIEYMENLEIVEDILVVQKVKVL